MRSAKRTPGTSAKRSSGTARRTPVTAKAATKRACKYGPRGDDGFCPKKPSSRSTLATVGETASAAILKRAQNTAERKIETAAGTALLAGGKAAVTAVRAGAAAAGGYGALAEGILTGGALDLGALVILPVAAAAALGWGIGKMVLTFAEEHQPDMLRFKLADAAIKSREKAADDLGRPLTRDELKVFNDEYKAARAKLEKKLQPYGG